MAAQDAIEAFDAADLPGVAVGLPLAIVGQGVSGRELTLEQLSRDMYEDEDGKPIPDMIEKRAWIMPILRLIFSTR